MKNYHKLPEDVRDALRRTYNLAGLRHFLEERRGQIRAKNWLNNWCLTDEDRAFVDFHNEYLEDLDLY